MEELYKSDNMYSKINETLNNLGVNNSGFKIKCPNEVQCISIKKIRERGKNK